ncbi:MAG: hypothetical protein A2498_13570 [Lentisphaerae bacterium RIFOXYC12_FULL_60_16]|nr:MAG: hypothetical protein A2498_13570 [Lentisphaerae bacterium RIFOXYC12_FULL_60_16]OGV83841.1 MAG: hypothetical protein A2340_09460 [Lentisphaerae bacterium RIFOXYB12_FULL_60_10]
MDLMDFAGQRFEHNLQKFSHGGSQTCRMMGLDADQAWHLFETQLRLKNTRQGKCYKDWLVARSAGEDAVSAMESGASLIMRDVVRDYLCAEAGDPRNRSLDAPIETGPDGDRAVSMLDLLPAGPDPADEVVWLELEKTASILAERFFNQLDWRSRTALLARDRQFALSDPVVLDMVGCAKSMLSRIYHKALYALAEQVQLFQPDETASRKAELSVRVFSHLLILLNCWGRVEMRCAVFFKE